MTFEHFHSSGKIPVLIEQLKITVRDSDRRSVFKLQNPIVLHCLISPLKNWDVWSFFYGVNSPIEIHSCNSFYELQKNLKVTRNPRENAAQGGTNIFTNTFVRHQIA